MVDGHAHGNLGGSKMLLMCSLNGCKTVESIREKLKAFIDKNPEMDKIQGIGWDDSTFGVEGPKAEMIDDLTDKPVMLIDYGHHSYWLNSAAMKYKNINKDTPDVADGVIIRDAEGNPTGCFREGAKIYFEDLVYHFTTEQYKKAVLAFQEVFLSQGLTMTFDPMVNMDYGWENLMQAYHQLDREGKLKMHIHGGYQVFADKNPVADVEHAIELQKKYNGKNFAIDNIKILLDGAVNVALDAFEKAKSKPEHRNAITHMQLLKTSDIDRIAKLGVVAVANPFRFKKEHDEYTKLSLPFLGKDRAENQYPMKSLFDKGIVVTQATDFPVETDVNPLRGIQLGIMRQEVGAPETLLNPKECVTFEQMMKAATINAAYELKCENILGSITVGKNADMVVLDSDITACKPEQIINAKVLGTMIGGEWVYTSK